ncbi:MAG: glycosyltransferase family 2 protein [Oscillospiraceae bacterium]|nr:glycosyltransferase family 2 protein [Oscillospiraceae bacterium]
MKISALWITKNEEKNLPLSLDSVKDVADEMIVVDTGSTDDTVAIAQKAGARVEHFEWINDFAAARNYALSFVTGDIILFLDADEWFVPALATKERVSLEKLFTENPRVQTIFATRNELRENGTITFKSMQCRILRAEPGLCFVSKIHEFPLYDGARPRSLRLDDDLILNHSGYQREIASSKLIRNIELLEEAKESEPDPVMKHVYYAYLVREYYHSNNPDEAIRNLKLLLEKPKLIRKICDLHRVGFADRFYKMLKSAADRRSDVSRLELKHKIVDIFKKDLKSDPGHATIDLYYNIHFDLDEKQLLENIDSALEAAGKITGFNDSYQEAEVEILNQAAKASFQRGNLTAAVEYVVKSLNSPRFIPDKVSEALSILLCSIRGLPAADVAAFLNSQFDIKSQRDLDILYGGTRLEGFRDVHAYYLDKRIKAGIATVGDYMFLPLIYGKYEEAIAVARKTDIEKNKEAVAQTILLAAICADNEKLYRENKDLARQYERVLEAYFTKEPFADTDIDVSLAFALIRNYPLIAFLAGLERADEFAKAAMIDDMYTLRAKYCLENGLYEKIIAMERANAKNLAELYFYIYAQIFTNRLEEAMYEINNVFRAGHIDKVLLQQLSVLADKAEGSLKTEADEMYDRYKTVYDKMTDLLDVVKTEYAAKDTNSKKEEKRLKELAPVKLSGWISGYEKTPYIKEFGNICLRAAEIYEKKSMFANALDCYGYALSDRETKSKALCEITRVFKQLGNTTITATLKKISDDYNRPPRELK